MPCDIYISHCIHSTKKCSLESHFFVTCGLVISPWSPSLVYCVYCASLTRFPVSVLAPGKFEWNFIYVIVKRIFVIDGCGISCENALIRMSLDFTNDQSTLLQVMAWCHQAASHYLSQCWPRSLSPYGFTRPQWVKIFFFKQGFWLVDSTAASHP